jgi:hypothetical protein
MGSMRNLSAIVPGGLISPAALVLPLNLLAFAILEGSHA